MKEQPPLPQVGAIPHFPKAYDNAEFMHGPHARTIRMLAEYLEPQMRLRQYKIRGTIVFFGSARALPPEESQIEIDRLKKSLDTASEAEKKTLLQRIGGVERMAKYYQDAAKLAGLLTDYYAKQTNARDKLVVCSGGGPGIMEAANRGATEAGGKTLALGISLPFEQGANRWTDPNLSFEFHYFFMRKYWFMYLSRALVVFPGGFGTCDELFEVLTLLQTHKVSRRLPIILYGSEYWSKAVNFDAMIDWGVISAPDMDLIHWSDTPEEAFKYLIKEINHQGGHAPGADSTDGVIEPEPAGTLPPSA